METQIQVLLLEDNPSDAKLVQRELRKCEITHTVRWAQSRTEFLQALDAFTPDLLLADYYVPGFDGLAAMSAARERFPDVPVIVVSGVIGEEAAIDLLKAGATDYVLKDRLSRLGVVVPRALAEAAALTEQMRAQQAIKEREEELATIYENAPLVMMLVDGERRVRKANKFAAEFAGGRVADLIGERTGNALRCLHSLEDPRGCGFGPHCEDCVVRRSVQTTFEAGGSHQQVEASLPLVIDDQEQEFTFLLSTAKLDLRGEPEVLVTLQDITSRKQAEDALRRERVLLESVMQTTDVMLVYLDPSFNFVSVNAAYAETCGMRPEEMIGKNHFELYPHAENEAIFRSVRDTGEPVFHKDKPFEFPDQPERGVTYWDWSLRRVEDPSGKVMGLVFSLRETTKYKQAEQKIEHLASFPERNPSPVIEVVPTGELVYINPAARHTFPDLEAQGIEHPLLANLESVIAEARQQRDRSTTYEIAVHDQSYYAVGYFDESTQRLRLYAFDITEQKQAERRLEKLYAELQLYAESVETQAEELEAQSEELQAQSDELEDKNAILEQMNREVEAARGRLEAVLRQMPAGVIIAEAPTGKLILANDQVEQIWRHRFYAADDVSVYRTYNGFHPDGRRMEAEEWPLACALHKGESVANEEIHFTRGDKTRGVMSASATPIRDAEGNVVAGVFVIHDITEEKEMEEALRRSRDELEERVIERTAELTKVVDHLREEVSARHIAEATLSLYSQRLVDTQETERARLARELHDELGQSLTALHISLQKAKRERGSADDEPLRNSLEIVKRLIQQVRSLSLELRPAILDDLGLASALRWYLDRVEEQGGFSCKLELDGFAEPASSEVKTACFRIVQEALTNVMRHARASEVCVALRRMNRDLEIVIRDDGIGFNVESYRTRSVADRGLGVFGISERVALLNGRIEIDSAPGQGTEIRASIPVRDA